MVCHDRWTSTCRVAEVPAPGQGGKDDVLQSRTDESQGLPLERFRRIVSHDSGAGATRKCLQRE